MKEILLLLLAVIASVLIAGAICISIWKEMDERNE